MTLQLSGLYVPSEDVVTRTIEGEIIIVPLSAEIMEDNDAIFTLNATGQEIWQHLDGSRTIQDVIDALTSAYQDTDAQVITDDVLGLVQELVRRKMLVLR